jgi:hypothetical protein
VNDRPDHESEQDSAEIAEVRRLLAETRHRDPMPADVASRLDDVLQELSTQRSGSSEPTEPEEPEEPAAAVIPIAAHRRRRAAGMLVAAAAIVVGGVVAAQNVHLSSTSSTAGSTAEDAAQPANGVPGKVLRSPGPLTALGEATVREGRVVVRARHFSDDALSGRRLLGTSPDRARPVCADLPQQGRVVPAEYRHAPAALVYRTPSGGSQVVDLYVCGNREPVRTTTLPAP